MGIKRIAGNARDVACCEETLDCLLAAKGLDPLTDEQRNALLCEDPADTLGMLEDFIARLGLPECDVRAVELTLFDMLAESVGPSALLMLQKEWIGHDDSDGETVDSLREMLIGYIEACAEAAKGPLS